MDWEGCWANRPGLNLHNHINRSPSTFLYIRTTTTNTNTSSSNPPPNNRNPAPQPPMAASAPSMPAAPPPWTLKGEVYTFPLWVSRGEAREMASSSSSSGGSSYYSPLEARSGYASTPLSRPVGGLGAVQVLRYHDSPVGPYDELVVLPGGFAWRREDEAGRVVAKGAALKITRIYVSQRETCYNGRVSTCSPPAPPPVSARWELL